MARLQKIQLRRGTAAQWTSANPVLESGEAGYEIDGNRVKIGDGTTAWTALPYTGVKAEDMGVLSGTTWLPASGALASAIPFTLASVSDTTVAQLPVPITLSPGNITLESDGTSLYASSNPGSRELIFTPFGSSGGPEMGGQPGTLLLYVGGFAIRSNISTTDPTQILLYDSTITNYSVFGQDNSTYEFYFTAGTSSRIRLDGQIKMPNLPTASAVPPAGLLPGDLWVDTSFGTNMGVVRYIDTAT